jgi:hypothetical protein
MSDLVGLQTGDTRENSRARRVGAQESLQNAVKAAGHDSVKQLQSRSKQLV